MTTLKNNLKIWRLDDLKTKAHVIFKFSSSQILKLLSCFLAFSSCQKVINIDLNSTSPQIVVQGNITNQPGPYAVQLTQTINFSEPNSFPAVSGAKVIIEDNAGNVDTLTENPPGTYTGTKLTGTPGRSYTLLLTANGKNYTAVSIMPAPVNIDSLSIQKSLFGNNKRVAVTFQDPAGVTNYYHFVVTINNVVANQTQVLNDDLLNGDQVTLPLSSDTNTLKSGDSVTVLLECIDKGVYNYYLSLPDASGGGNGAAVAPANPPSNISNAALGYFSAYAVTTKSIIIQ
jgi:hypothetical protein